MNNPVPGITRDGPARAVIITICRAARLAAADLSFGRAACSRGVPTSEFCGGFAAQLGTICPSVCAAQTWRWRPFDAEPHCPSRHWDALSPAERQDVLLPVDAALTALAAIRSVRWRGERGSGRGRPSQSPWNPPESCRVPCVIYAAGLGFLGWGRSRPPAA